jgi:hypothetical protein
MYDSLISLIDKFIVELCRNSANGLSNPPYLSAIRSNSNIRASYDVSAALRAAIFEALGREGSLPLKPVNPRAARAFRKVGLLQ